MAPQTPAQNPLELLAAFRPCDVKNVKLFTMWPQLPFSAPTLAILSVAGLQSCLHLL